MAWWKKEKADPKTRLIDEIVTKFDECAKHLGRNKPAPRVMDALWRVPRENFVGSVDRATAYANRPLPIGSGQTISQPFIVAAMTDLLEPVAGHRVLEIGTGSGYQAAVLSALVNEVYSIETVNDLERSAADRFRRLGYANVFVRHGDGAEGWPEAAPFDGIMVTCAAPETPPALIEQLKPGGRIVIPLDEGSGRIFSSYQILAVLTKRSDGSVSRRDTLPVAFVPFVTDR